MGANQLSRQSSAFRLAPVLFFLLGACPASLWATDQYVDIANCPGPGNGTQGNPFCAIQDAIDAAQNGDTVHIAPGRYVENLTIDKDLILIGTDGRAVTIVDGGYKETSSRCNPSLAHENALSFSCCRSASCHLDSSIAPQERSPCSSRICTGCSPDTTRCSM